MDSRELPVYDCLDRLGIPYERFSHAAAMTMEDCDLFDAGLGAAHFKNLFLCNRQGTAFYLLLVVGDKPFQTKDMSRQLGVSRLSFGTPEQLLSVMGLTPGAVTPMGLIHESAREVTVLIDRDVLHWERAILHPNVNTASIVISMADLNKFLSAMGNRVIEVDVPAQPAKE